VTKSQPKTQAEDADGQNQKSQRQPSETAGRLTFKIGGLINIAGVDLRVHYVHAGKRRITLVPVSPDIEVGEE